MIWVNLSGIATILTVLGMMYSHLSKRIETKQTIHDAQTNYKLIEVEIHAGFKEIKTELKSLREIIDLKIQIQKKHK